jgi:hypothetical protein
MNFLPQLRSSCRLDRLMIAASLVVSLGLSAEAQQPAPTQQPIKPEQPRTTPDSPQMPERPFNDLFVGGRRRTMGQSSMSFTLAGYGGYDSNVVGDQGVASAGIDPRAQGGGSSMLGGDAGFQYATTRRRASFSVNAAGSYRYFPAQSSLSTTGVNGGIGAQFVLGRRTSLRLDQGFAYQPYYQLGLFPGLGEPGADLGAAVPSNLDFVVLRRQSVVSTSSASIEQSLTRRSTLTFNGQYFRQTLDEPSLPTTPTTGTTGTTGTTTNAPNTFANEDVQGYTAGVHYRWQATRYVSVRLGDEYRRFTYPNATQRVLQGNNIDAGVDYSRSLPFSRHTSLSFRTGTAIVDIDGRRYGNVTGSASLTHMFNRSWQGALSYNRDMSFVQTLAAPLFGDSASASLQGIVHRNIFVGLTGGFMSGRLGYSKSEADSSKLNTGTGAFTLAYAFTNNLRATFDYSYFTYHFSETALLPQGLQPSFDRHSVRGGLQLVLPLIR